MVCESELAFLPLGKKSVVAIAVERAKAAHAVKTVSVWLSPVVRNAWAKLPNTLRPDCAVVEHGNLQEHAKSVSADIVLVHDAQRPLAVSNTFDRVAAAVTNGITCARPAHVVVDTLKQVDDKGRVTGTFDRNLVQALTSPEGYLRSAIQSGDAPENWRLAVSPMTRELVRGDQESLKIRAASDVLLVESFLVWQTREANQR